ncbi:MAG: Glutamate racemase [Microgenomates bacterium OLB23]|nr:MAG: Glutamate racemase [Microgenomates bacterium OLB23]
MCTVQIGIIDSGQGGKSFSAHIERMFRKHTKCEVIIDYFADTENFPYGNKSKKELELLTERNICYLAERGNTHIVIACNTASIATTEVVSRLEKKYKVSITPITKVLNIQRHSFSTSKKVLVIATDFTIRSRYYKHLLKVAHDKITVRQLSLQQLVRYVEEDAIHMAKKEVSLLAHFMHGEGFDGLVLGCTHYSYIYDMFKEWLRDIHIFDPSYETARHILLQHRCAFVSTSV